MAAAPLRAPPEPNVSTPAHTKQPGWYVDLGCWRARHRASSGCRARGPGTVCRPTADGTPSDKHTNSHAHTGHTHATHMQPTARNTLTHPARSHTHTAKQHTHAPGTLIAAHTGGRPGGRSSRARAWSPSRRPPSARPLGRSRRGSPGPAPEASQGRGSDSARQWNTQGKGTVLAAKAVEHTRQRHCLGREGSGTHKAKALS